MAEKDRLSRRRLIQLVATAAAAGGPTVLAAPIDDTKPGNCDHTAWVSDALKRMQTIEPGMTREELLRVFSTEGGISTALQRTFVSRDCPYFKADVTFRNVSSYGEADAPSDFLEERQSDVIVTISRPYLQFSVMD